MRPNPTFLSSHPPTHAHTHPRPSYSHHQLVFEVIDRAAPGVNDPHALKVALFETSLVAASPTHAESTAGGIPIDRETEIFTDYAGGGDGIFSLTVSAHRLPAAGPLFLGVQCTTESRDVNFRAVVMRIESELELNHKQHGEVCPGGWVYFHMAVAAADAGRDLLFTIEKYEGDFSAKAQHEYAPVRLVYPYIVIAEADEYATLRACDVEENDHVYVGVKGGEHCALFDILAHWADEADGHNASHACDEEDGAYHAADSPQVNASSSVLDLFELVPDAVVLRDNVFHYASCQPTAWAPVVQFALVPTSLGGDDDGDDGHRRRRTATAVDDSDDIVSVLFTYLSTNLVFEVENLADYDDPEALSVAVWPATEFEGVSTLDGATVSTTATDGIIAVGLNYIDLKYVGHHLRITATP